MHDTKKKPRELILLIKNISCRRSIQVFLFIVATAIFSNSILAQAPTNTSDQTEWRTLWNKKDFTGWTTWLNKPEPTSNVPGIERDAKGNYTAAIGLNTDPLGVFTIVEIDGKPAIRISGEVYGELRTVESFRNYHLRVQFKWGTKKWPPINVPEKRRNSGIYYNIHSAQGAGAPPLNKARATEFQIMEHDLGDLYAVGSLISVRCKPFMDEFRNRKSWIYDPEGEWKEFSRPQGPDGQPLTEGRCAKQFDNEYSHGEWNTLELICLGDDCLHIVNGKVVMRLHNPRRIDRNPPESVTEGPFFLQSEYSEVYFRDVKVRSITTIPAEYR